MLLYGLSGGLSDVPTCSPGYVWNDVEQACDYPTASGPPVCSPGYVWNAAEGACDWPTGTAPGAPNMQTQGSGSPWWATLTQALATGVTQGVTSPGAPAPVVAPAWYTTPVGIGGLAVGVILLVFLLKK